MTAPGSKHPVLSLHNLAGEHPEAVDHIKDEPAIAARLQALHDAWAEQVSPGE
jgi:hypothetical protein